MRHEDLLNRAIASKVVRLFVLPDQKESITDVLIGRSTILIYLRVSNFSNLVYKQHDLGLKNFSRVSKVTNITETVDSVSSLTRHHRVKITTTSHIFGDDARTCFTKANSKEMSNFDDGFFQNSCLKTLILLLFTHGCHDTSFFNLISCSNEWILSNEAHLFQHTLNRNQHKIICILLEINCAH